MKHERTGHHIVTDIAKEAMATFQRNIDTMVAGFLIRNPDARPEDVELVMRVERGEMKFMVEPKELHVPKGRTMDDEDIPSAMEFTSGYDAYIEGWNACRAEMLKLAKMVKAPDGTMVMLLSDKLKEQSNG